MKKIIISSFFLLNLFFCNNNGNIDNKDDIYNMKKITGNEALAISKSLSEFLKLNYNVELHTVYIQNRTDNIEIIFVPRLELSQDWLGSPPFGIEAHYIISKKDYKIIKKFYGK